MARGIPRKIICLQDGAVYDTLTAAAEISGIDAGSICRCCKRERNFAGGMTWRYLDELIVPETQQMSLRQICDRELAGMVLSIAYGRT